MEINWRFSILNLKRNFFLENRKFYFFKGWMEVYMFSIDGNFPPYIFPISFQSTKKKKSWEWYVLNHDLGWRMLDEIKNGFFFLWNFSIKRNKIKMRTNHQAQRLESLSTKTLKRQKRSNLKTTLLFSLAFDE